MSVICGCVRPQAVLKVNMVIVKHMKQEVMSGLAGAGVRPTVQVYVLYVDNMTQSLGVLGLDICKSTSTYRACYLLCGTHYMYL